MADLSEESTEDDRAYKIYGEDISSECVTLPNFKDARELDTQWTLDIIDGNLPVELNYRGYVPIGIFKFGFDELELTITVDLENASHQITPHVENYKLQSRPLIDGIRWALRESVAEQIKTHEKPMRIIDSGLIVLRLLEEVTSYVRDYRRGRLSAALKEKDKYWDLSKTNNINSLLDPKLKMKGVDLDTVQGAATEILGKSPAQICQDLPPEWRILHCENVLRKDLMNKFVQFQQGLREKLMKVDLKALKECVPREHHRSGEGTAAKEQLVEYLTKVRISFHGTRREQVSSIVQHGFLKPGDVHPVTKKPLSIFNGSLYGQGIYSSPEASYALMYSKGDDVETKPSELPGLKLIVCATIMGRTACLHWGDKWWDQTEPYPGADSHVNDSLMAYITFSAAQIIPCYVLHLDWTGIDEDEEDFVSNFLARYSTGPSTKQKRTAIDQSLMPGDRQRKKEELIAKGQKFFAYGFGPVDGKKLVIEDVAEIDDDEEEYGEYQGDRIDVELENPNIWDWGQLDGETAFDEYASARKAKINRRNPDKGGS